MEVRFTQAARRHLIGRGSVRFVLASSEPTAITTAEGGPAWLWVGVDERGRELEIIAVQAQGKKDPEPVLLVLHYRKD